MLKRNAKENKPTLRPAVIREAVIGCPVFFQKIFCIKSLKCGIFAAQTSSI
jgi:hypothetical protein